MQKILSSLLVVALALPVKAQDGYDIRVKLKAYKNSYIYLGYYYGKVKALADSVMLNSEGVGSFKGKEPLHGGIYFIVSPKKEILFEVLVDKRQHFGIIADTANMPAGVIYSGSPDNTLFHGYSIFANKAGMEIGKVNAEYATAKSRGDSMAIRKRLKLMSDRMQRYRDSLSARYPSSFLATMFAAMKEPQVPSAPKHSAGTHDSLFAYHYYKAHYWDGVSFTDERLVRTPFFEPRLDKYFQDLVPPQPDSINKEVDRMILEARTSKEMYKYLLVHFVQKYITPVYMGQDAVFVHLFEKYVNTGQTDFFTEQYKEFMTRRAYSLMANLIGQPAADMDMVDTAGKPRRLYDVSGNMIVICFWDPTCSHCKETVPKVDSIFQAKWKAEGVTLYGVMVDGGKDNWLQFIREHDLKNWIHVYQPASQQEAESAAGKPGFRQLYDVYQTPILYLLDGNKRIVAKKLDYLQLDEVITLKLKNVKSN